MAQRDCSLFCTIEILLLTYKLQTERQRVPQSDLWRRASRSSRKDSLV